MSQPGLVLRASRQGFDVATWAFGCGYALCRNIIFGSQQGSWAVGKFGVVTWIGLSGVATHFWCRDMILAALWSFGVVTPFCGRDLACWRWFRDPVSRSRPGFSCLD